MKEAHKAMCRNSTEENKWRYNICYNCYNNVIFLQHYLYSASMPCPRVIEA